MSRTTTAVACPTMIIRKDYRDLNDAEKQRFVNAIQELRRRPSTQGQRSLYDDFTFIHAQFLDQIHGQPMFAPWHREMMRRFEAALHSIDSSVTLPYYDVRLSILVL
ncbi:hypothetical protein BC830DRAFT_1070107 [Chytriomyces sp. MP71]|nr:hypothetical protein BC830DRAFT_1070107 [Chytriomyces sp. MP71]